LPPDICASWPVNALSQGKDSASGTGRKLLGQYEVLADDASAEHDAALAWAPEAQPHTYVVHSSGSGRGQQQQQHSTQQQEQQHSTRQQQHQHSTRQQQQQQQQQHSSRAATATAADVAAQAASSTEEW
jgi:hypothetical protein